jgi:hypothetical protein
MTRPVKGSQIRVMGWSRHLTLDHEATWNLLACDSTSTRSSRLSNANPERSVAGSRYSPSSFLGLNGIDIESRAFFSAGLLPGIRIFSLSAIRNPSESLPACLSKLKSFINSSFFQSKCRHSSLRGIRESLVDRPNKGRVMQSCFLNLKRENACRRLPPFLSDLSEQREKIAIEVGDSTCLDLDSLSIVPSQ